MKTLVGFFFRTNEKSVNHYDVWILVENEDGQIGCGDTRSFIQATDIEASGYFGDKTSFKERVEFLMGNGNYKWEFFTGPATIGNVVTYFI